MGYGSACSVPGAGGVEVQFYGVSLGLIAVFYVLRPGHLLIRNVSDAA